MKLVSTFNHQFQPFQPPAVSCWKLFTTVAERAQRAATSENTFKLRKHFPQFDNTHAANAHNTTKNRNTLQIKCIWLCCEHLQRVSLFVCVVSICTICCQNDENAFLICWCFFYFSEVFWSCSALSSLGHRMLPTQLLVNNPHDKQPVEQHSTYYRSLLSYLTCPVFSCFHSHMFSL